MINYMRIHFKTHNKKARWYWVIKIKDGLYKRVTKEGDTEMSSKIMKGNYEEILMGKPLIERKARMNLHYAWLEVCDG